MVIMGIVSWHYAAEFAVLLGSSAVCWGWSREGGECVSVCYKRNINGHRYRSLNECNNSHFLKSPLRFVVS